LRVKLQRHRSLSTRIGLTPLIDVVFLLLVFFMLASTFLRFNYLPLASGGQGASAVELSETVIVRVQAGGILDVNGTAVEPADLPAALDKWAREGIERAVLRVVSGAQTRDLVSALDAARRSEIDNIVVVR
jgi:biopolymer transport protein ExbD